MAVAHDAATEFSTFTTGNGGGTHTPVGTPAAVVVKAAHGSTATDLLTGAVTYGGVAMERVMTAQDTATEVGRSYMWFLGEGIPTGPQTVVITTDGGATVKWATCETFTAATDCEISAAGGVDQNMSSPTVRLWKPQSGMATFVAYLGGDPPSAYTLGGNMTAVADHDFGNFSARSDRETSPSSGDQVFTWTAGSDDTGLCAISISEIAETGPKHLATSVAIAQNATTTVNIKIGGQVVGKRLVCKAISRDHTSGTAVATISDDGGGNSWSADRAGDSDRKVYVWEKEGTAADVGAIVTISGAVGSLSAQVHVYSDVGAIEDVSLETNASGNETHATFDPSTDGSVVDLTIADYGNDTNAVTSPSGATSGAFTIVAETLSTGGSDCRLTTAVDLLASGATGSVTWSQGNSTTKSVLISLPPSGFAGSASPAALGAALTVPAVTTANDDGTTVTPTATPAALTIPGAVTGGPGKALPAAITAPVTVPSVEANPTNPGGLPDAAVIVYYDARTIAGSPTDPVSSWADSGPNGEDPLVQASGTLQPLIDDSGFNGLRSVLFDGSDDRMEMTLANTYTGDFAFITVLELLTYPTGTAAVIWTTGSPPMKNILGVDDVEDPPGWVVMSGENGTQAEHHHGTADQTYLEDVPSRFVMTELVENDNRLRLWENGTLVVDEAPASTSGDLNDLEMLLVGCRENIARFANMRLGALLVVDMAETDLTTLLAADTELQQTWGVTSSTPATATPAALSTALAIPAGAPSGVGKTAPNAIAVSAVPQAVTTAGNAVSEPSQIPAGLTIPGPSLTGGAVVEVGSVDLDVVLPQVAPSVPVSVTPAALTLSLSIPQVSAGSQTTVTPAATAAALTLPAAGPAGAGEATPAQIGLSFTVGAVTLEGGAVATPATLALSFSVPAAAAITSGAGLASPAQIASSVLLGAVSPEGGGVVQVDDLTATLTIPAAAPDGAGKATPAQVALAPQLPVVAVDGPGVATPDGTELAFQVPGVTVSGAAGAEPGTIELSVVLPAPTLSNTNAGSASQEGGLEVTYQEGGLTVSVAASGLTVGEQSSRLEVSQ